MKTGGKSQHWSKIKNVMNTGFEKECVYVCTYPNKLFLHFKKKSFIMLTILGQGNIYFKSKPVQYSD